MENLFDVFISYGRKDSKNFAIKLHEKLTEMGLRVWFDQNDIPPGVDWQNQIDDGIEKTHNFIFIVAPHSVKSPYCRKEIELAYKYKKRIIPLLHVKADEHWELMHPSIQKINWLLFQEEINDFEDSFSRLINVINSNKDYVHKHTKILLKALKWSRHKKPNNYLLNGEERKTAQTWIKTRFLEEQAPCEPSEIHCDYIGESMKNANNFMTDVFISHASQDVEITQKIANTLRRESWTTWISKTDIKTGKDFQQEIYKGIEEADNIVYLISEHALRSKYCQQEIEYGLKHNKRLVPLLIDKIALEEIPEEIRHLQYIDFTEHQDSKQYRDSVNKLLHSLKEETYYYKQHKLSLVKALKWEREDRNPSILSKGHIFEQFESWLKIARNRAEHPPLPIQIEYIEESRKQAAASIPEVFIAYSRGDSDFARRLNEALQRQGKNTWFDQEDINSGADYEEEIKTGIDSAANFLFIISPKSLESPYCVKEIEYARQQNKRIVTVLYKPVSAEKLHPALKKKQWLDFNQHDGDFYANFSQLIRTLDTDREYVHNHNKWLHKAKEWEKKEKTSDLLLRGLELSNAREWLEQAKTENKKPAPTALQNEFICASEEAIQAADRAEKKRQKQKQFWQRFAIASLCVGLIAALFYQKQANKSRIEALRQNIRSLSEYSQTLYFSDNKLDALKEALIAWQKLQQLSQKEQKQKALDRQVKVALRQAVYGVQESNRLEGHKDTVWSVAVSPDGKLIASGSGDNTVKLWNKNGSLKEDLKGHQGTVYGVAFSPDGTLIASASADNTIKLWNNEGKFLTTIRGHQNTVFAVAFNPNGKLLASASADGTARLWRNDGTYLETIGENNQENPVQVFAIAFSRDGKYIATAGAVAGTNKMLRVWSISEKQDGNLTVKLLKSFPQNTETDPDNSYNFTSVAFSPDGQDLVAGTTNEKIKLWKQWRSDKGKIAEIKTHEDAVNTVAFSSNGKFIVSGGQDNTIKFWRLDGTLANMFSGHTDGVQTVAIAPESNFPSDNPPFVVSGSFDRTVRIWKLNDRFQTTLYGHLDGVTALAISTDLIVSGSEDRNLMLWQRDGTLVKEIKRAHKNTIQGIAISPDGALIASASKDKTIKIWRRDGTPVKTLQGHKDWVSSVAFSPNNKYIVSGSYDNTVKIWKLEGNSWEKFKSIDGNSDNIFTVAFSPDGKYIAFGGEDNTVKLWNFQEETLKDSFCNDCNGHKGSIYAVAFSPDGKYIASGSGDNTVKLWKIDGTLANTLNDTDEEHQNSVRSVTFSPDGKYIASGSGDKTMKIWNKENGRLNTTLKKHTDKVNAVAFSPDGTYVASASHDRTIVLWKWKQIRDLKSLNSDGCQWVGDYVKNNEKLLPKIKNDLCQIGTPKR
ncbi:MAG: TIR domain-containing protein [Prochloraceae cyanobacterium]|nr:TIR domain-containing protein [Prochloraceae cyanobacterium]